MSSGLFRLRINFETVNVLGLMGDESTERKTRTNISTQRWIRTSNLSVRVTQERFISLYTLNYIILMFI